MVFALQHNLHALSPPLMSSSVQNLPQARADLAVNQNFLVSQSNFTLSTRILKYTSKVSNHLNISKDFHFTFSFLLHMQEH